MCFAVVVVVRWVYLFSNFYEILCVVHRTVSSESGVDSSSRLQLKRKKDLKLVSSESSSEQSELETTASNESICNVTFDKEVQLKKKPKTTHCEFLLCFQEDQSVYC